LILKKELQLDLLLKNTNSINEGIQVISSKIIRSTQTQLITKQILEIIQRSLQASVKTFITEKKT